MGQAVLRVNITKDYIELTDMMIAAFTAKEVQSENMNIWIAKVPLQDIGGIITASQFKDLEGYKSGLARVLCLPRLLNADTDAKVAVGDYIIFNHASVYTVYTPVVNFLLGTNLEWDTGKEPMLTINDTDIMAVIKSDIVHKTVL